MVEEFCAGECAQTEPDRPRMLIVDDSRLSRAILANAFKNDYIIEEAADGRSALERLRRGGGPVSVVLLDLVMPDMDGYAVLAELQRSAELRAIPAIVVSADEECETKRRVLRAGAADLVTKPIDYEAFRLRVRAAISGSGRAEG